MEANIAKDICILYLGLMGYGKRKEEEEEEEATQEAAAVNECRSKIVG